MNPRKIAAFILVFVIGYNPINAQFYNTGQERTSTKWSQIDTEHFRLIYPTSAETKAQYFAQRLQWAADNVPTDMGERVSKIDIIMHFESSTSNGMVIWAPKRMEVHSIPGQKSYAEDWFEQLAIHEYRHVVQIDHINQGLTKLVSLIFGEAGLSVVLGAYLPLWYLEGDAVAIETALSNTGRGRMSDFAMPLKAQLLEFGSYSYDKATLGSYKNFVPNHYILGYHLVTMGTDRYGNDLWKNTEDFVARNPYYVVPFSHSIYKQSGLKKKAFYKSCMTELTQKWESKPLNFNTNALTKTENKFYTSYRFGQMLNDSILVALKTGIDDYGKFVSINLITQKESKIITPGYSYFENIDLNDSNLFWIERRYHPRWQHVKYQVVMKYDFRTHKKTQLSHRTNYSFVIKNPIKDEIACINNSMSGVNSIKFISLENNAIIKEIIFKEQIKNIEYSDDGNNIYFYKLQKSGFGLYKLNIDNEIITQILKPSFENRDWINIMDSSLLYVSDKNGISNIFALNLNNKSTRQITDIKFGIGAISSYHNKIIFDNYTASGWGINSINKNGLKTIETTHFKPTYYKSYITDSSRNIQVQKIDSQYFETKKYYKLAHLLNIHSWGPFAIHANSQEINPGISIMTQNIMSNLDINIGYEYILNEEVNRYYAEINYSALFPKFSITTSYQDRKSSYYNSLGEITPYTWNETDLEFLTTQNIILHKGSFSNYIRPLLGFNYQYFGANGDTPLGFPIGKSIQSIRYGINASTYFKMSSLDIYPRWGQTLNIEYRHTPIGELKFGSIMATEFQTFLPGFGRHHTIRFYYGFQKNKEDIYSYSNIIRMPRGVVGLFGNTIKSYRLSYDLPLLYPDISITSIAYIKRIKTSFFADYAIIEKIKLDTSSNPYNFITKAKSIGCDLRFDLHILRTMAPLDLGIRTAFLPETKSYYFQFLFSVNI